MAWLLTFSIVLCWEAANLRSSTQRLRGTIPEVGSLLEVATVQFSRLTFGGCFLDKFRWQVGPLDPRVLITG